MIPSRGSPVHARPPPPVHDPLAAGLSPSGPDTNVRDAPGLARDLVHSPASGSRRRGTTVFGKHADSKGPPSARDGTPCPGPSTNGSVMTAESAAEQAASTTERVSTVG